MITIVLSGQAVKLLKTVKLMWICMYFLLYVSKVAANRNKYLFLTAGLKVSESNVQNDIFHRIPRSNKCSNHLSFTASPPAERQCAHSWQTPRRRPFIHHTQRRSHFMHVTLLTIISTSPQQTEDKLHPSPMPEAGKANQMPFRRGHMKFHQLSYRSEITESV